MTLHIQYKRKEDFNVEKYQKRRRKHANKFKYTKKLQIKKNDIKN